LVKSLDIFKEYLSKLGGTYPDIEEVYLLIKHMSKELNLKLIHITNSRCGLPVYGLVRGDGVDLLIVCGDPNEAPATLSLIALTDYISRTSDIGLISIPVLDPCSYRFNLWVKSPGDLLKYFLWSYRPPMRLFPEYGFLNPHLPESISVRDLINELRPKVCVGLHTQPFPGSYILLSESSGGIEEVFRSVSKDLNVPYVVLDKLFDMYPSISDGCYSMVEPFRDGIDSLSLEAYSVLNRVSRFSIIVDTAKYTSHYSMVKEPCSEGVKYLESLSKIHHKVVKLLKRAVGVLSKYPSQLGEFWESFSERFDINDEIPKVDENTPCYRWCWEILYNTLWRDASMTCKALRLLLMLKARKIDIPPQLTRNLMNMAKLNLRILIRLGNVRHTKPEEHFLIHTAVVNEVLKTYLSIECPDVNRML